MKSFRFYRNFFAFVAFVFLTGCQQIFETDADVQARQALFDLMEIQEKYFQENNKYARNLVQIEKYNLKYHTGIVYLQIESSGKEGYRAISLPAESTTARVFAFDSAQGGFYEMDQEEVSKYVLGLLKSIREEQKNVKLVDFSSLLLVGLLMVLGIRFILKLKGQENKTIPTAFFLSLVPLCWSVAMLNHMNPDVVISSFIQEMTVAAMAFAILSLIMAGIWSCRKNLFQVSWALLILLGSTVFLSLYSGGILIYEILTYFKT